MYFFFAEEAIVRLKTILKSHPQKQFSVDIFGN